MSMRASSLSVSTRMALVMRYARSTPRKCVMSAWASTRPIVALASSSAAFTVYIASAAHVLGEPCPVYTPPAAHFLGAPRARLGLVPGHEPARVLVEFPRHDLVDLVQREVDAMVGYAALREVVRADAVAAIAGADQPLAGGRFL